jgi:FkbM family methyltransferase
MKLQRVRLPDGIEIWAPNALEAEVLFREIVTDRTYEQHGVAVRTGDVVFDVGANVGLFTVHMARTVPAVRIHAFEPIPALFEGLQRNISEHAPAAAAQNVALGASDGEATFTLDPSMTLSTSMRQAMVEQAANRQAPVSAWAAAALADYRRVRPGPVAGAVQAALRRPATRGLALAALAPVAVAMKVRQRISMTRHVCAVRTLSGMLASSGEDRIDLAKVDVEGAEEDVLMGVADADWPRIRQLVVEVHDVDGRAARLRAMLDARGYRTAHTREDWDLHALLGISTVYAVRA